MTVMNSIHEPRALKLLMQLLRIDGVSTHEGKVAKFIVAQLRKGGVPGSWIKIDDANKRSPRGGEVGNVICKFPGTAKGPRRLFSAHMDTVPICEGAWPVRKGDILVSGNPNAGLAGDNRSSVAVILYTAIEILRRKLPHPPLTFVFFIQEEAGLLGARYLDMSLLGKPKLGFNFDSDDPARLQIGATGSIGMAIDIEGIASHAGNRPHLGVSAIAIAGLAIADLQTNGWHGRIEKGKRRGTSNMGTIRGGQANGVVADHLSLRAGARSRDKVFRGKIVEAYRKAFERAIRTIRNDAGQRGRLTFKATPGYEAFTLPENDPSVLAASEAVRSLGMEPETFVTNGGVDATWLTARGLPTVTLGSGQSGAHTLEGKVTLRHFFNGCRLAMQLATQAGS
jgi:tripeptide aminopeptidase